MDIPSSFSPQKLGPMDEEWRLEQPATNTASYDTTPPIDLGATFSPDGSGMAVVIVVSVTAIKTSVGDESYAHKLQQSADGETWTDAGPLCPISATGVQYAGTGGMVNQRFIRRAVVIGGTLPTITCESWLQRVPPR